MAKSRSLLADLRLGFSLGVLALGFATAVFADVTLRHAMATEDGKVLLAEGHSMLLQMRNRTLTSPGPESSLIEWWLLAPDGKRLMGSAGSGFLGTLDWRGIGTEPSAFQLDSGHLYSVAALPSPSGTLQVAMDRSSEIQIVMHFRRDLAMLLLFLTGCAAIIGHLIARRGLRPLAQIRDETSRIEAQDLHRRLDASRFPEELADLVGALNGALGRLEISFNRLEAFSSDLAHELRTPLQNLRAELEGLLLRPRKELDLPDALGSLLEELGRLDGMVDQMLFLARSSVPGTALERRPLAADEILQETASYFSAAAEEAAVAIQIETPPGLLIHADLRLVRRALQNLVANALRHTPPGGRVTLSAKAGAASTEIIVADTGDGIPPEVLPRLGDRFLRVEAGRARTLGGAGLGLAIVKGITELHGGTFTVESVLGQGTRVKLGFPNAA